jgi:hypothetical protein
MNLKNKDNIRKPCKIFDYNKSRLKNGYNDKLQFNNIVLNI